MTPLEKKCLTWLSVRRKLSVDIQRTRVCIQLMDEDDPDVIYIFMWGRHGEVATSPGLDRLFTGKTSGNRLVEKAFENVFKYTYGSKG